MARVIFLLALLACLSLPAAAQKPPDETIIVTANAYPVPFNSVARTVFMLTREEIQKLPVRSVVELLGYASSVDVRTRGALGAQADFSVRGSNFSQVLVLVDGVRINDPQTGHHNADLPLSLADVDRVEVLYGPGSALHGADAFGGIINIITVKEGKRFRASGATGQYDLLDGSLQTGFQHRSVAQSFSFFGSRSAGFMFDRDFRTTGFTSRTSLGESTSLFVGFVDKEFGANGFYGPSPSKEWTNQTLISGRHQAAAGRWMASIQGSYRTHGDRFTWDIRRPGFFENRHRTHAAGFSGKAQISLQDAVTLNFGAEAGRDWITSSNLGNHVYVRGSAFAEAQLKFGGGFVIYPGFRFDHYSTFGSAASPSLSVSWWPWSRVKIRSAAGRAFRAPTFTELYYRDPNHQASAALRPEKAWGAEVGTEVYPHNNWMGSATLFSRRERDVIDWVRRSPAEKWKTANIREFHVQGAELTLNRSFASGAHWLRAHYTFIAGDPGPIDYQSKYVLDYARHSWAASATASLPHSLGCSLKMGYRRHADGRSYRVLDGRLARKFGEVELSLDGSNLLNAGYQEVTGVDMPGRWLSMRLTWSPSP